MTDSWSVRLLRAALKVQERLTDEVSPSMKRAGAGRKARVIIEGEDGGELLLMWTGDQLVEESSPDGVRNDFTLHAQTLFDLATGELAPREALAARLVTVTGDRSIYDQEDIVVLFERLQQMLVMYLRRQGI